MVPTLREIQEIYPSLFLLASPWSPPGWMKTYGTTVGGRTQDNYIGPYTRWFWDLSNESMLAARCRKVIWRPIPGTRPDAPRRNFVAYCRETIRNEHNFLHRHKQHISKLLVKANDLAEIAKADTSLDRVRNLLSQAERLTGQAERAGSLDTALRGIGQVRPVLLLGEVSSQLRGKGTQIAIGINGGRPPRTSGR
jgi:Glycosyl hydrolase family 30 TIM-barrel domain